MILFVSFLIIISADSTFVLIGFLLCYFLINVFIRSVLERSLFFLCPILNLFIFSSVSIIAFDAFYYLLNL